MRTIFPFVLFAAIAASFKNDAKGLESMSSDWSSLSVPGYVTTLREYSAYLLAGIAGIVLLHAIHSRTKHRLTEAAGVLGILACAAISRALAYEPSLAINVIIATIAYAQLYLLVDEGVSKEGLGATASSTIGSLCVFGACLTIINTHLYVTEQGYVSGVPRFFGTTTHPNFLGIQLALFLVAAVATLRTTSIRVMMLPPMILAAILLVQTGSRTGLIVMATGVLTYLACCKHWRPLAWTATISLVAAFWLFGGDFLGSTADVYDRGVGGSNTRAGAWSSLIEAVLDAPIFGHGLYKGASENSYLRMMANNGIPYGLLFIWVVTNTLWNATGDLRRKNSSKPSGALEINIALLVALLIGGMFEGYLADYFSIPSLTLYCCIFTLSLSREEPRDAKHS